MKMVKSLLLGTAAGLVAMTGAQAADLPVKAKPVQYVKICSLYGAGFYYVPGTDTCLKIGGWVRVQTATGYNGDLTAGPLRAGSNFDRIGGPISSQFSYRIRGYITADARSQTEYGTLRSYIAVGTSTNDAGANTFNSNRAFIQLAGFTIGLAQSFYDFASMAAVSYNGGAINNTGDTGDGGKVVWGYTARFGNGFSATLAAEQRRITGINRGTTSAQITAGTLNDGQKLPDLVANLRLDQAWGSAQIMGALHDVGGQYYAGTSTANPGNEVGYAVGAGLRLNAPMIGRGDYFQIQANWARGATGYVSHPAGYGWADGYQGQAPATLTGTAALAAANIYSRGGYGLVTDAVYGSAAGGLELTTAWGVFGSFEHNWNAQWKTSLYGTYTNISYSDTANNILCGSAANVAAGCSNNFRVWSVGSRTAWAPVANLEVGLDIIYQRLETASDGATLMVGTAPQNRARTFEDRGNWMAHLRVQRNFYP
ncbi:MAG: porin [Pseudolabrys sp.]|nr:porin [Pseudolabrys sp.]